MDRRFACAVACNVTLLTATATLAVVGASRVGAQTLTAPNPQIKSAPPSATAKSLPVGRVKSCSTYGAGFVSVPGTDACVKIGGSVTMDGAAGFGR